MGEEANLGSKLFQVNPAARTKEKKLKRPLFYRSWRACWGPHIPAPHDTFLSLAFGKQNPDPHHPLLN